MSTKASIKSGDGFHLYEELSLDDEMIKEAFLQLDNPMGAVIEKDFSTQQLSATVVIPVEIMDQIAIAWIKKRQLQGAVGDLVGNELGSPDCPWE